MSGEKRITIKIIIDCIIMKDNIIYCFYFDEYDDKNDKFGLYIDSTKFLVSKLKYYNSIYPKCVPLTRYYVVEGDCYKIFNDFTDKFNVLNSSGCYDLILVSYDKLEDFLNTSNIKYTVEYPTNELLHRITEPIERNEFVNIIDELHKKQILLD